MVPHVKVVPANTQDRAFGYYGYEIRTHSTLLCSAANTASYCASSCGASRHVRFVSFALQRVPHTSCPRSSTGFRA